MIKVIDLKTRLAEMPILHGRRPDMLEAERQSSGAFATLAPYRDGNLFFARFSGGGAWERHPNGDELVQIVDGTTTFHFVTDNGIEARELKAGSIVVVPQGMWHRFESAEGVTVMTATPKPTEHLTVDVDDPRTLSDGERSGNTEEKWR